MAAWPLTVTALLLRTQELVAEVGQGHVGLHDAAVLHAVLSIGLDLLVGLPGGVTERRQRLQLQPLLHFLQRKPSRSLGDFFAAMTLFHFLRIKYLK